MGLPQRKIDHYTYADYAAWPDDVRYELIDGEAYAMAPAPTRTHQLLVGELFAQVYNALKGKPCQPFVAPFDVRLPHADEADERVDTVVQPDVLVVRDPAKVDERGVRGAPDWVAEVISPSSAAHDQITKLALYERAGVLEYWLLHPTDRLVTVYRLVDGRYGRPEISEMKDSLALGVLPAVTVDWSVFPN
ncbi:MAG: Uma2 family endonuclease [Betaproteobacteria bacterium]|nr:Uma2 family endonuclease [Betaproteobacteria bacterium]